MSKENSFDIVSRIDLSEVANAIQMVTKEIQNRFDFKGSKSSVSLEKDEIVVISDDEYKLSQVKDILASKLVKRNISLKNIHYGKVEPALGGTVRQRAKLVQGIEQEVAKKIVKQIKESKLKVQAAIQGDQVRVSGKSRDDLQKVIAMLKQTDYPVELQFVNYR